MVVKTVGRKPHREARPGIIAPALAHSRNHDWPIMTVALAGAIPMRANFREIHGEGRKMGAAPSP